MEPDEGDRSFNPCDFIESYESIEDCAAPDSHTGIKRHVLKRRGFP
jgi:hypothetical protein